MLTVTSLTTDVPALHSLVREQQQMIDTLKEQLRKALRREFGRQSEAVDIDQLVLFAAGLDPSTVVELCEAQAEDLAEAQRAKTRWEGPAERKRAVRVLKDLPREIRIIDVPEQDRICPCCQGALHAFGEDSSEHLGYVPASVKIIETRRKKYACGHCHGYIERAPAPKTAPLPKGLSLIHI